MQVHCHQHAELGNDADRAVLAAIGVDAEVLDSGCCGLAGNFGFEKGHYEVSMACAERVLLPAVRAADPDVAVLADGFSCRTQLRQAGPGHAAMGSRCTWPSSRRPRSDCPDREFAGAVTCRIGTCIVGAGNFTHDVNR